MNPLLPDHNENVTIKQGRGAILSISGRRKRRLGKAQRARHALFHACRARSLK